MGTCCSVEEPQQPEPPQPEPPQPEPQPQQRVFSFANIILGNRRLHEGTMDIIKMRNNLPSFPPETLSEYHAHLDNLLSTHYDSDLSDITECINFVSGVFGTYMQLNPLPDDFILKSPGPEELGDFDVHNFSNGVEFCVCIFNDLTSKEPLVDIHDCNSYHQMGAYIASVKEWTPKAMGIVDWWFTNVNTILLRTALTLDNMAFQYQTLTPIMQLLGPGKMMHRR